MKKKYWEMTADELAAATKQFDEEFVIDKSRPLTRTEREQWKQFKRKRGRPKTGVGCQRIAVSIEKGLLRKVDAFGKKRGISRSRLIAQAVEKMMARDEH
jgi:hypothetical protein